MRDLRKRRGKNATQESNLRKCCWCHRNLYVVISGLETCSFGVVVNQLAFSTEGICLALSACIGLLELEGKTRQQANYLATHADSQSNTL